MKNGQWEMLDNRRIKNMTLTCFFFFFFFFFIFRVCSVLFA